MEREFQFQPAAKNKKDERKFPSAFEIVGRRVGCPAKIFNCALTPTFMIVFTCEKLHGTQAQLELWNL